MSNNSITGNVGFQLKGGKIVIVKNNRKWTAIESSRKVVDVTPEIASEILMLMLEFLGFEKIKKAKRDDKSYAQILAEIGAFRDADARSFSRICDLIGIPRKGRNYWLIDFEK